MLDDTFAAVASSGYALCAGCGETKHLDALTGMIRAHNKYVPLRAGSQVFRCAGSGCPPLATSRAQNGAPS